MAPFGTDQAQPGSAHSGHKRLDGGLAGPRPADARPAEPARLLGPTLLDCADSELSGVLQVLGDPGGVIFFAHGQITAITTPGPERLLRATGRALPPRPEKPSPGSGRQGAGPGQSPGTESSPANSTGPESRTPPGTPPGPGNSAGHETGPRQQDGLTGNPGTRDGTGSNLPRRPAMIHTGPGMKQDHDRQTV